jgi:hypothetical protein
MTVALDWAPLAQALAADLRAKGAIRSEKVAAAIEAVVPGICSSPGTTPPGGTHQSTPPSPPTSCWNSPTPTAAS